LGLDIEALEGPSGTSFQQQDNYMKNSSKSEPPARWIKDIFFAISSAIFVEIAKKILGL
jgi:hypothetical protein